MRVRWQRIVLVGALVAAGCSGGDDGTGGRSARGTPDADQEVEAVFPAKEWQLGDPAELGFDPGVLEAIAESAQASGAECFLVARHGRLVGEWYGNGTDAATPHNIFSITKSYTSTLVGIAQTEGLLDIDDPASTYIPALVGTPSENVTIRQMLGMVSGRDPVKVAIPEVSTAYFGAPDLTAYALDRQQVAPPGTRFVLNEADIQLLGVILENVTGQPPDVWAAEKLFRVLGDDATRMVKDQVGNALMDAFALATCRDVARLGHLYLNDGTWDGTQVVSPEWVEDATGQQSQDVYAGYGLLWWINRPGNTKPDQIDVESFGPRDVSRDQLVPGGPDDLYWAIGAYGQVLQVHPASDTVVVRLGMTPEFISQDALDSTARVVTEALVDE